MPAILGKKIGMTSVYDDKGRQIPVTVIEAGPCQVLQVKTAATDGYTAVQLGFADKPERLSTRPLIGHFKKAGATPKRFVREYRTDDVSRYQPGQAVTVAEFEGVGMVDVIGVSKGRGFQGVMKRHRFCGQPATTAPSASTVPRAASAKAPVSPGAAYASANAWPVTWATNAARANV
jgi:large subunit ribosomal protein L3